MRSAPLIAAALALVTVAAPAEAQCLDRFGCARLSDDPMSSYRQRTLRPDGGAARSDRLRPSDREDDRLLPPTYWPPSQRGLAPSYQGYGPSYPGYVPPAR